MVYVVNVATEDSDGLDIAFKFIILDQIRLI